MLFSQNHNEIYDLAGEKPFTMQKFSALLTAQGITVLSLNQGKLDDEILKGVDVLVFTYPQENLSKEEIEAIKKYVANGGGLIVLGGQRCRDYVNPLLTYFEMEMGFDVLQLDGKNILMMQPTTHEIFSFVEEYKYYTGPAVLVEDPTWIIYQVSISGDDWPITVSREYGAGRVFVSGDADFLNNYHFEAHDNAQLGYNIILYTGGRQPIKLEETNRFEWVAVIVALTALAILGLKKVLF